MILSHLLFIGATSYLPRIYLFFIRSLTVDLPIHLSIHSCYAHFFGILFINCATPRPVEHDRSYISSMNFIISLGSIRLSYNTPDAFRMFYNPSLILFGTS